MSTLKNLKQFTYMCRTSHPLLLFCSVHSELFVASKWLVLIKEQPVTACSQRFGGNHLTLAHRRDQSLKANTGRETQLLFYLKPDVTLPKKTYSGQNIQGAGGNPI